MENSLAVNGQEELSEAGYWRSENDLGYKNKKGGQTVRVFGQGEYYFDGQIISSCKGVVADLEDDDVRIYQMLGCVKKEADFSQREVKGFFIAFLFQAIIFRFCLPFQESFCLLSSSMLSALLITLAESCLFSLLKERWEKFQQNHRIWQFVEGKIAAGENPERYINLLLALKNANCTDKAESARTLAGKLAGKIKKKE